MNRLHTRLVFALAILLSSMPVKAVDTSGITKPDNAGILEKTLPKELGKPQAPYTDIAPIIIEDTNKPDKQAASITVKSFKITGNSLVTSDVLRNVIQAYQGKSILIDDIKEITKLIGEFYRSQGYWASAYLPDQDVNSGDIWIDVVEAKLGAIKIQVEGELRFSELRSIKFIESSQAIGGPIKILDLEKGLDQLNAVAGVKASLVMNKGTNPGETDVIIKVSSGPRVQGVMRVDNYGGRATGYVRGILSLGIDSPFGLGEQFTVIGFKTAGIDYTGLGVSYPLLNNGLKVSYNFSKMDYTLGFPLAELKALGSSKSHMFSASQPFLKTYNGDFSWAVNYASRSYLNEMLQEKTSDKEIDAVDLSIQMKVKNLLMDRNITVGSLNYIRGKLDLSGLPQDLTNDAEGAKRQGYYSKTGLTLTNVKAVTEKDSLWLTTNAQYAFKNLDSSEKMLLGGASGIRAYPTGEAAGDHGIVINAEWRHQITPSLQTMLFYDWGKIVQNYQTWTDWNQSNPQVPNGYTLKGAGLGLTWKIFKDYDLAGTLAHRVGNNPGASAAGNEADGTHKHVQAWVSLTRGLSF